MNNKPTKYILGISIIILMIFVMLFSSCYPSQIEVSSATSEKLSTIASPSFSSSNQGRIRARLEGPDKAVSIGGTFRIWIMVNSQAIGISSGDVIVYFDPVYFNATDIKTGSLLGNNPLEGVNLIDNTKGHVELALARVGKTQASSLDADFASINFTVKKSSSPGKPRFSIKANFADQDFRETEIQVEGTSITIQ
jgi:hypothetical protein